MQQWNETLETGRNTKFLCRFLCFPDPQLLLQLPDFSYQKKKPPSSLQLLEKDRRSQPRQIKIPKTWNIHFINVRIILITRVRFPGLPRAEDGGSRQHHPGTNKTCESQNPHACKCKCKSGLLWSGTQISYRQASQLSSHGPRVTINIYLPYLASDTHPSLAFRN